MNPGASDGRIPAIVSLAARARVTAGFANDVDAVNQYAAVMYAATANGMICCTAAGNAGHDTNPATSALIAPADALEVITCGAVDSTGAIQGKRLWSAQE